MNQVLYLYLQRLVGGFEHIADGLRRIGRMKDRSPYHHPIYACSGYLRNILWSYPAIYFDGKPQLALSANTR